MMALVKESGSPKSPSIDPVGIVYVMATHNPQQLRYFSLNQSGGLTDQHCHP